MKVGSIFLSEAIADILRSDFQERPNIRFDHVGVSLTFLITIQPFSGQLPGPSVSDQNKCPKDFLAKVVRDIGAKQLVRE